MLDGGLATELEKRGYQLGGDLWSARILKEDPEAIQMADRDLMGNVGRGVVPYPNLASEPALP